MRSISSNPSIPNNSNPNPSPPCSFENFQEIDAKITELFNTWDAEYDRDQPGRDSFRRFFKELHGRRGQLTSQETSFTTPLQLLNSLKFQHFPLKERWGVISSFRTKHNR